MVHVVAGTQLEPDEPCDFARGESTDIWSGPSRTRRGRRTRTQFRKFGRRPAFYERSRNVADAGIPEG